MAQNPARRSLRTRLVPFLLLPAIAIACGPPPPPPPPSPAVACDGNRWIGIKLPATTCAMFLPASPGWLTAPLFPGATAPTLTRYCLYTWDPSLLTEPTGADIAALMATAGGLKGFAEDCPIVVPLGFRETAAIQQRTTIHAAAGGLDSLPASPAPDPVRLSIVDNAPDSAVTSPLPPIQPHTGAIPFGEHGEVLAYLGRDIGCPEGRDGPCAVHVETTLALRSGGNAFPQVTGGLTGRRGDVAVALRHAVDKWRIDVPNGGEKRLVLNLSIGWEDHPDAGDCHVEDPERLDAPSESVYDALLEARCHGALIVAAAGNHTGRGSSEGLMCPAHFASWPVPECDSNIISSQVATDYVAQVGMSLRPPTSAYDPLVHPVGAVDFGDIPLSPHRPQSLPRLVAPGLLGASYEGYLNAVTRGETAPLVAPYPLTGTSVSTAVVSAAAAAAWSYAPSQAPADIVALMYDFGAPVSPTAEASPLTTPTRVTRASLCRTLRGMGLVPATTVCSDPEGGQVATQNVLPNPTFMLGMEGHFASGPRFGVVAPDVQSTPLMTLPTEAAMVEVAPQPAWPSCPTCGIQRRNSPILRVDPPPNVRFSDAHLVIRTGSTTRTYSLGSILGTTTMDLSPNVMLSSESRVYLAWETGTGNSAYAQLPVW